MDEINNDKLNDTKYLLEDSECKSINLEEYSNIKNNNLNNTQLLLEEKSLLSDIPFNNNNIKNKEDTLNNDIPENNINNDYKQIIDNSIKEIMKIHNINIEKEKDKDEQEIIKQQNILLNNQSSHLEELFSLSYTDLSHNIPSLKMPQSHKNKNIIKNNNINNNINKNIKININNSYNSFNKDIDKSKEEVKKVYFGFLFPTEQKIKHINYKNNDIKKIICFKIRKNKNYEYFKLIIDNNKNYFNLKSNEEIKIKVLLKIPFTKNKNQISCELDIIDINNNLVETIFLYANIDIPKLCCLTYKNMLKECNIPLISINVNCKENQKFKIPLKNLSFKDIFINFFLLSSPNKDDKIRKYIDYEIFFDTHNNFIIPSCDVNYFEIIINIKKNNKFDYSNFKKNNIKIKKIIRANIIETTINYYFCAEFILITESLNNCNNNIDKY